MAGGINLYNYVSGNPVNLFDPYGLDPVTAAMISQGMSSGLGVGAASYAQSQQANRQLADALWSTSTLNPATYLDALNWLADSISDDNSNPNIDPGGSCPNGDDDDHFKQRKDEAKAGDSHREIGDTNRTIQQGKKYVDTETGNTVHVRGNRVVVTDGLGSKITQFKNPRANTLNRIRTGRWVPTK